ncbi:hypothetical protein HCD_07215 [Helicobacter cetorum MIT 99-5656]|uniref:Uncharacterized protein n=1 Tax=Helicobacter cetorum (strain ATCC BAA-540 / CCUG 52418 / MIT 99-5656) TaxID=1163745 RepID=I0EU17_HELCM|nr:hypothetical protein HCD_07215 [Helicobacter cetorum MIT 99-5656]
MRLYPIKVNYGIFKSCAQKFLKLKNQKIFETDFLKKIKSSFQKIFKIKNQKIFETKMLSCRN